MVIFFFASSFVVGKLIEPSKLSTLSPLEFRKKRRGPEGTGFSVTVTVTSVRRGGGGGGGRERGTESGRERNRK